MPAIAVDPPAPLNHVFVDFENVQEIDLAVIGNKAVSFTLLVGPRQTKLDVGLVEKLFEHAASVQLVRLASSGRNALDFILTYYVGRAVAFDPTGRFHIISKDTGFDRLIEHLLSKRIDARRHNSFATIFPAAPAPPIALAMGSARTARVVAAKPKPRLKPRTPSSVLNEQTVRVLEHLGKPSATHPRNKKKLVSYLVAYFGHKITEAEALKLIDHLCLAGHIAIGEKDAVSYQLQLK
jgi:hypothetical protein